MHPPNRRPAGTHVPRQSQSILNITEEAARISLLRLISIQLDVAGFTHVNDRSVMENLEGLVSGFMDGIVHVTYQMAQLCRRSRPNVRDMIAACADQGIEIQHLNEMLSFKMVHDLNFELPVVKSENPGDPTLEFLPSDPESDEDDATNGDSSTKEGYDSILIRSTAKRQKPTSEKIGGLPYLPCLPARHAWRHTKLKPAHATVLPPEHLSRSSATPLPTPNLLHPELLQTDENDPSTPACLGFLNQRIRGTRMVERSLTNLMKPHSILEVKSQLCSKGLELNSDESFDKKYHVSEDEVPIINFERDWYENGLCPPNLITDHTDEQ